MGVFKYKGIKTVTNTEEFWPAAGQAASAFKDLRFMEYVSEKLPPGAYIRTHPNPDHAYRAVLLSAGEGAPPGSSMKFININVKEPVPPPYEPPIIHKTAPEKAGPPGDVARMEQIPYIITAPALYAYRANGAFVGLALATGEGFEGPYKYFPYETGQGLYPFAWGQWSRWSSIRNLAGYFWDPMPTGELWDAWREQKPLFLKPRQSRKSSDDPPKMVFAWEYPSQHEAMMSTDYTPPQSYVDQWVDGCSVEWRWCGNCVQYGYVRLFTDVGMVQTSTGKNSWQMRIAPVDEWPCGPEILAGENLVAMSESGVISGSGSVHFCGGSCDAPGCSPCDLSLIDYYASIACDYAPVGYPSPRGHSFGYKHFKGSQASNGTIYLIDEVDGSTMINAERGFFPYLSYSYEAHAAWHKYRIPRFSSCGCVTEEESGYWYAHGEGYAYEDSGREYSDGQYYFWIDGEIYMLPGRTEPGGATAPVHRFGNSNPRYYTVNGTETLVLYTARWRQVWDLWYIHPKGNIKQNLQFPLDAYGRSEIPGLKVDGEQLYMAGPFTFLKYYEVGQPRGYEWNQEHVSGPALDSKGQGIPPDPMGRDGHDGSDGS